MNIIENKIKPIDLINHLIEDLKEENLKNIEILLKIERDLDIRESLEKEIKQK